MKLDNDVIKTVISVSTINVALKRGQSTSICVINKNSNKNNISMMFKLVLFDDFESIVLQKPIKLFLNST